MIPIWPPGRNLLKSVVTKVKENKYFRKTRTEFAIYNF